MGKRQTKNHPAEILCNRPAKVIIKRALKEDMRDRGDITTRATIPSAQTGKAVIIAKERGVIAGQAIAAAVFDELEKGVKYTALVNDGDFVEPGTEIASLKGKMWVIVAGERTALNILGRCCGIASLTRRYVDEVSGTACQITETRKTAPGLRYLDKASVLSGGGVNHRIGLYDAFLIKENHIAAIGGIREAILACKAFAAKHGKFPVMVEAEDFAEFQLAQSAAPDRILLDNMTPDQIRECVAARVEGILLEATGGITLENVMQYAETGVDLISIGALTHSVKALDLSLLVR